MIADDSEQIKRRIKDHLQSLPKIPITCDYCKKLMCHSSYYWEGYHFDCYKHLLWVIITQEKRTKARRIIDSAT